MNTEQSVSYVMAEFVNREQQQREHREKQVKPRTDVNLLFFGHAGKNIVSANESEYQTEPRFSDCAHRSFESHRSKPFRQVLGLSANRPVTSQLSVRYTLASGSNDETKSDS